jgi:hypothetical protein
MEHGATDMLPMDLKYPSGVNRGQFVFDWRTYLCTVCTELQKADEWAEDGLGVSFRDRLDSRGPNTDGTSSTTSWSEYLRCISSTSRRWTMVPPWPDIQS